MLIFDIETDGLDATEILCMAIKDTDTGEIKGYRPSEVKDGIKYLLDEQDKKLVGHNIINFDIPVIERLYDIKFNKDNIIDTLVIARLVDSNLKDTDNLHGRDFGSYSLRAYGKRLGCEKGEFTDFSNGYSDDMLDYNIQDVEVNHLLYRYLMSKMPNEFSLDIEHKAQHLMYQMGQNGFKFNVGKAKELAETIKTRLECLTRKIKTTMPQYPKEIFIPKRDNKTLGYKKGVPVQKYVDFNPNSRQQLQYYFEHFLCYSLEKYKDQTDGTLKMDEGTFNKIAKDNNATKVVRDTAELLIESLMLNKRLGQIEQGTNAWLKLVTEKGYIHGSINPNGAVSGRATHSRPNIAQVPSIASPYGKECRELFSPQPNWIQVGIDASGLELRCLAHYIHVYDNGSYAEEILHGDIHTYNQERAGLPTRDDAKRFIYAFLYGAGNLKLGEILGGGEAQGKNARKRFLESNPSLKQLISDVQESLGSYNNKTFVWKRKFLYGLDKRKLHVRSAHSSLNLLLQSAGALICKCWIIQTEKRLINLQKLHHGNDFKFLAWVHDEIQVGCRTPEIAEIVAKESQQAMRDTQTLLGVKCRLDTEYKIGLNWAECH